ncbi:hypothetical protein [Nocardia uniformis]|uniref:hypothetical protein n=1 Tax=Nocardia uniformis TaxID=53432 RepID=UPI00082E2D60|nr:hypothetical protein [Nocardia uniformis]
MVSSADLHDQIPYLLHSCVWREGYRHQTFGDSEVDEQRREAFQFAPSLENGVETFHQVRVRSTLPLLDLSEQIAADKDKLSEFSQ